MHAEHALRPGTGPAAELLLHLARGLLGSAKARLEEARNGFQAAQQLATALVARPALSAELRGLHIQTLVRLGDTSAARVRIGELTAHDRTSGATRVSLATLHLAEDNPEATVDVLAPVLDGSAPAMKITAVHASLLLALARDLLGDKEAAESSVERALELAEPDALMYPFVATPVRRLLENHPRHRTADAALLSDILDVLAGSSLLTHPQPRQDLSDSELRVLRYLPSNLSAAEIGNQLYLSVTTIKTPHAPHLRQARRASPHRSGRPCARTAPTGAFRPALLSAQHGSTLRVGSRSSARSALSIHRLEAAGRELAVQLLAHDLGGSGRIGHGRRCSDTVRALGGCPGVRPRRQRVCQ